MTGIGGVGSDGAPYPIPHDDFRPKLYRWNVMVTYDNVIGCTGSYRWRWRARIRAHRNQRFWAGDKKVEIVWAEVCPECPFGAGDECCERCGGVGVLLVSRPQPTTTENPSHYEDKGGWPR